ncbi:mite allergen Eur m 3-like [Oppia nitens]|uniref:mite allergen Eur m 3-like n=1 Tax=Oppia nitens TaxID=1686743 RepID=UPI0023DCA5B0|nr:mite allergen Eur m 3-like [Oppia nitens]
MISIARANNKQPAANKIANPLVPARSGDFPWMVSIQSDGRHQCGGTILNARTILTVARCTISMINTTARLTVRYGSLNQSSGGTVVPIRQILLAPKFNQSQDFHSDWSLIKLAKNIVFDNPTTTTVAAAKLAPRSALPNLGQSVWTAGWSFITNGLPLLVPVMEKYSLNIVDRHACNGTYEGQVDGGLFCAAVPKNTADPCQLDIGGPVSTGTGTNAVVIGLFTFSLSCFQQGAPAIFTSIGQYRDAIDKLAK